MKKAANLMISCCSNKHYFHCYYNQISSLCINAIIQRHDSLRWLAIIQCDGSLLSLVIILLQGSLQVLAVMLRIGSLRFVNSLCYYCSQ